MALNEKLFTTETQRKALYCYYAVGAVNKVELCVLCALCVSTNCSCIVLITGVLP